MTRLRVTDEMVQIFLVWARHYGEIEAYEQVAESGRKWRIVLPAPTTADGKAHQYNENRIVPREMVFTNREALAFGYGLAAAGARPYSRATVAREKWGWEE